MAPRRSLAQTPSQRFAVHQGIEPDVQGGFASVKKIIETSIALERDRFYFIIDRRAQIEIITFVVVTRVDLFTQIRYSHEIVIQQRAALSYRSLAHFYFIENGLGLISIVR